MEPSLEIHTPVTNGGAIDWYRSIFSNGKILEEKIKTFFLFWTNGSPNTLYSCLKCILVRFSDWSKVASSSGLGGTPSLVALDLQAAWNVGYHLVASRLVQEVVVAEEEARWSATSYSCS